MVCCFFVRIFADKEKGEYFGKNKDSIKDYSDITELDADTLNRLIRRIVVHENITKDGDRELSLEIHYNFRPMDESKTYNLSDYAEANPIAKAV